MKVCPVCSSEYPDDIRFCPKDGQTLRSSSPGRDLVGQVVADRYHVMKKLGEGGMGQVYLAEHVKMGRRSAIKVLNPSMVHDPDAVARFNREAANASRISHPNICAIYDFGETPDGLIYLAMEFVEGEPLTDVLAREGALPVTRAADICVQVAAALQAAHDLGIVHRDLKPDNVMLTRGRDGTDGVKVVDFGIAKAVGGGGAGSSQKVTKTGLVIGTPEFMSPEQLAGDVLDGRSDIYSLALVFFNMLTGTLPFPADSAQEAMVKRLTDEPAALADVRPDRSFPPGLQEVLDTALARSPLDRYQSAAKFAHDVAAVVGLRASAGAPVPSTWADEETELVEPVRRRRRSRLPLIAAGVVVALGAAGAAAMIGRNVKPNAGAATSLPPLSGDTTVRVVAPPSEPVAPARRDSIATPPRRGTRKPPVVARPRIDVAQARSLLDHLVDILQPRNAVMVRDSARHIYDAPGISERDKAYAAFVAGIASFQPPLLDRPGGCAWVRIATELHPRDSTYSRILTQCSP
ncbi:MAG: hypothetical protein DMD46_13410 [Gemmatimonadetes bacterium]|nr:MAG: hypothetical protein DMD46_13410 [Gemmatimonadota bacterium]